MLFWSVNYTSVLETGWWLHLQLFGFHSIKIEGDILSQMLGLRISKLFLLILFDEI